MLKGSLNRCLYLRKIPSSFRVRDSVKHCNVCQILSKIGGQRNISNGQHYLSSSTYDKLVRNRRDEAEKSFIVEINSKDAFPALCNLCERYGKILKAFYYKTSSRREAVLIEYESAESAKQLLKHCSLKNDVFLPVKSRLLRLPFTNNIEANYYNETNVKLSCMDNLSTNLHSQLLNCESISEQLKILYERERINELGIRLRFMICKQIEEGLSGLFPSCQVLPFGSTLNGFGKNQSDLDMALTFGETSMADDGLGEQKLYFQQCKHQINGKLSMQKRILESLGDLLQLFYPSISKVQRILGARVPIVKFHHDLTEIDCDLSMGNLSGYYMSELIHLFGQIDHRLYPLVFTIRKWAKVQKVTQLKAPGPEISNFALSILVIFFLQNENILPTLNTLKEQAGEGDYRITDDINCTFLRDARKVPKSENKAELGDLLTQFFEFYEQFDFYNRAISIVTGRDFSKPSNSRLHIENPLQIELNVSQNVNANSLDRFQAIAKKASDLLVENTPSKSQNWGIVNLITDLSTINSEIDMSNKTFQVKDLFDPDLGEVLKTLPIVSMKKTGNQKAIDVKPDLNIKLPILNKSRVEFTPPKPLVKEISSKNTTKNKRRIKVENIWKKW